MSKAKVQLTAKQNLNKLKEKESTLRNKLEELEKELDELDLQKNVFAQQFFLQKKILENTNWKVIEDSWIHGGWRLGRGYDKTDPIYLVLLDMKESYDIYHLNIDVGVSISIDDDDDMYIVWDYPQIDEDDSEEYLNFSLTVIKALVHKYGFKIDKSHIDAIVSEEMEKMHLLKKMQQGLL